MQVTFSSEEVIRIVQPRDSRGSYGGSISTVAALDAAGVGDLAFLGNPKYRLQVASSKASIILLPTDYVGNPASGQLFLLVDNPSAALAQLCLRIEQSLWPKPLPGIHPSAIIGAGARIAKTATVGPLCVVEEDAEVGEGVFLQGQVFVGRAAKVGEGSWLMPGVIVSGYSQIGRRVRLQPGVVIGSEGFGYEFVNGRHEKIPQVGIVVLGDDVEIGANSTIDRARFSRTVIGEGSKIDNLVQIGHNVSIGKHCILCAQVGISGSTTIEDYVVMAGQAGAGGHITIGKGSKIAGQAGVTGTLAPGSFVIGTPCIPYMLDRRINVLKQRLPELFKRIDKIEEQLNAK